MDLFVKIAKSIIEEQESVIGPLAWEQAEKVHGLRVDQSKHEIMFEGNKKTVIDELIHKYEDLFGQASVEVCRQAVRSIITSIPANELPHSLQ